MKHSYLLLLFCFASFQLKAQSGTWTWMRGSQLTAIAVSNYGVMGVAAASNEPPERYQAAYWTDLQGNFWMFGGVYNGSQINDLWMFNPTTKLWTWIGGPQYLTNVNGNYGTQGVPAPINWPGARGWGANCWTDLNGDLWMFGGYGFDANGGIGGLDDLWRYHIATNEWTWMKGNSTAGGLGNYGTKGVLAASNLPPGLQETKSSYVDLNNNLWMFGGADPTYITLNTLWKYDMSSNNWVWMSGSNVTGALGVFGTMNVPAATNEPPAKYSYTKWVDQSGNFYLFSGDGTTNDSWRFNPTTNQWTWIGGNTFVGDTGIIVAYCNSNDYPIGVMENRTVQTFGCGNFFWEFGGLTDAFNISMLNSLWFYDAGANKWSLVSGSQNPNSQGSYGTLGVAASSNMISARMGNCMWMDNAANVWIFGGYTGNYVMTNDLWRYQPDTACLHVSLSAFTGTAINLPSDFSKCGGVDTTIVTNHAHIIGLSPASNLTMASDSSLLFVHATQTTTFSITLVGGCGGKDTQTVSFTITILPPVNANFSSNVSTVPIEHPEIIFTNLAQNATSVAYYYNNQLISTDPTSFSYLFNSLGKHCIKQIAINNLGCTDSFTLCIDVIKQGNVAIANAFSPNHDGLNDVFFPETYGDATITSFKIYNRWGQLIHNNATKGWDGTYQGVLQPNSVFVYVVEATRRNENGELENIQLKGDVTLIR